MIKSIILGILASLFFSFTFILNKQMNISGGSWAWSSSLRYIFMLIILFVIMLAKKQLKAVLNHIAKDSRKWIVWSTVGFGMFYTPLCFASAYGASWLVAGTWQVTIIAGALMSPLFFKTINTNNGTMKIRNKIPSKYLIVSLIILLGIFLMIFEEASNVSIFQTLLVIIPIIIAAFAYPLGNRKMIEVCNNELTTIQRVFGMTLCSMPFWLIISIYGGIFSGLPNRGQVLQSFIVAVFSGIFATILFFKATDIVSGDVHKLAVVESTQSLEVVFTLIGGIFIFHDKMPTLLSLIGIFLVIVGMIINCIPKD